MNTWTEFQISLVYFFGLSIALIISLLSIFLLKPLKQTIGKIGSKLNFLWGFSFKATIVLAGLLGAMSVSFRDCSGNYDYLLKSRYETAVKGFEQISSAFDYLSFIFGLWFLIFLLFWMVFKKNKYEAVEG